MEKKQYIKPLAEKMKFKLANLMITASPGVGGEYNPDLPIDAKDMVFDEDEDEETDVLKGFSLWN